MKLEQLSCYLHELLIAVTSTSAPHQQAPFQHSLAQENSRSKPLHLLLSLQPLSTHSPTETIPTATSLPLRLIACILILTSHTHFSPSLHRFVPLPTRNAACSLPRRTQPFFFHFTFVSQWVSPFGESAVCMPLAAIGSQRLVPSASAHNRFWIGWSLSKGRGCAATLFRTSLGREAFQGRKWDASRAVQVLTDRRASLR